MILFVQWLVSAVHSSAAENWAEHKLVVRLLENYNPQVSPFGTAQKISDFFMIFRTLKFLNEFLNLKRFQFNR